MKTCQHVKHKTHVELSTGFILFIYVLYYLVSNCCFSFACNSSYAKEIFLIDYFFIREMPPKLLIADKAF